MAKIGLAFTFLFYAALGGAVGLALGCGATFGLGRLVFGDRRATGAESLWLVLFVLLPVPAGGIAGAAAAAWYLCRAIRTGGFGDDPPAP